MPTKKFYNLTHPQKRILYTDQTFLNSPVSNVSALIRFSNFDNVELLEKSVNYLVKNNDAFRLRLTEKEIDDKIETVQYLADFEPFKLDVVVLEGLNSDLEISEWARNCSKIPFDLYENPLCYFAIVVNNKMNTALYCRLHHIIADGGSYKLIGKDIFEYYKALKSNPNAEFPVKPSYLEYLEDEKDYLLSEQFESDKKYWVDIFGTLPSETNIAPDKVKTGNIIGSRTTFRVPDELRSKIHSYAKANKTSIFKVFFSAMAVYLSRTNRNDEVVISTASANRTTPNQREMTGMFVSTIPLRVETKGETSFRKFSTDNSEFINYVLKTRQKYPYNILSQDIRENADYSLSSISNVIVLGHPDVSDPDIDLEYTFQGSSVGPLILRVNYHGKDGGGILEITFDYYNDLFNLTDVENIFNRILCIISDGVQNPEKTISALNLLTDAEKEVLLYDFQGKIIPFQAEATLHQLFEERVNDFPNKTALVFQEKKFTYKELNIKVNQLAHLLSLSGVGKETAVGIMAARAHETVIAFLAVLKAGGSCLPIDYSYPNERIKYMLSDAGARILLYTEILPEDLTIEGLTFDLSDEKLYTGDGENPISINSSSDVAYLIYTSGSTGQPKGVQLEHKSIVCFLESERNLVPRSTDDKLAVHSAFTFDGSMYIIFAALTFGCELHVLDAEVRMSHDLMNEYFEKNNISFTFLTTPLMEAFMEYTDNKSLKYASTGGDRLTKFIQRDFKMLNGYGPTETTVFCTVGYVEEYSTRIPIGKPLPNYRLYVIDKFDNLQPIGYEGELCVAGVPVARGYINKPDKTSEKFTPSPFKEGEIIYRTGDLVRWLPNGEIDFIGRTDFQVKIRGFRVEISEIEGQLLKHKAIKETVIIAKTDSSGKKYLVAYLVTTREVPIQELKAHIKKDLPEYMVPSVFMRLEKFQLNTNGKVDRRALPEPLRQDDESIEVVAPSTNIEIELLVLFKKILEIDNIGTRHNFFELGGHSLKSAILQAKIKKDFGMVISLSDVFKNPTVKDLAQLIASSKKQNIVEFKQTEVKDSYLLSKTQSRLYFLTQMEKDNLSYNIPATYIINGNLDKEKLSTAIDEVFYRHDALRTSFEVVDGTLTQKVHKSLMLKKMYKESQIEEIDSILHEFIRPFDLAKAPLFRVQLVSVGSNLHYLMFDFHHIVFDGTSVGVFMNELWQLYAGNSVPDIKYRYRDFIAWQGNLAGSENIKLQEKYWKQLYEGDTVLPIELPLDRTRTSKTDSAGRLFKFSVGENILSKVKTLSSENKCTMFMTLFTVYSILLHRYSSQEDIVIGIPSSGRTVAEMENILGMFVNTLPLRIKLSGSKTFLELLTEIKNIVLQASDNQDYQLDALIEFLNVPRIPGRNPLFDVMFAFQSGMITGRKAGDMLVTPKRFHAGIAKFDISFSAIEDAQEIRFEIEYKTGLFDESTIQRMSEHFLCILTDVLQSPGKKISRLNILTQSEREMVFNKFNDNALAYPNDITISEMFLRTVKSFPQHIALVFGDTRITYEEINRRANRLARYFRSVGIGRESAIAIFGERRWEPILAMLAVHKAGGFYTTIDPSYPAERINYILSDSGSKALICVGSVPEDITFSGEVIDLIDSKYYLEGDDTELEPIHDYNNLAYVIYTSGSTGQPKGVMIEHHSVINMVYWDKYRITEIDENDRVAEYPSFAFDASVIQIYPTLLNGAELHILDEDHRLSLELLKNYFDKNNITLALFPTQFCELFNEFADCKSLRFVCTGGDRLVKYVPRNYTVVNEYGPTEYTVATTYYKIQSKIDRIPIGKPAANTNVYIVDKYDNLQPIGIPGELCISGVGLARGYINKPEKTAEKFVPSPFAEGELMYRTGDLVKWLPDGNIDFIGRIDFQVKIRGFRIELSEIDGQILKYPGILEAIVLDKVAKEGDKFLAAYFTAEKDIDLIDLKEFIKHDLPDYMVPAAFIRMQSMPLNSSGKINRKLLPEPVFDNEASKAEYLSARDEIEAKIVEVWSIVLGIEKIGVYDNFFDLGGQSLKAVAVVARLQKEYKININDIFEYQTVEKLAKILKPIEDNLKHKLETLKESVLSLHKKEVDSIYIDESNLMKKTEYIKRNQEILSRDLSAKKDYKNILLTGTTGYLGVYMLKSLLEETNATIYCIIRGKSFEACVDRLKSKTSYYFGQEFYELFKDRIKVVSGDLSAERLGLDNKIYLELANAIECILHPAATVKHYGKYIEFYEANVLSTERVIKFAETGLKKDFNFVSTISVAHGKVEGVRELVFTEDDCYVGQEPGNHYIKTKLEAEVKTLEARMRGLNTSIFRVGNLTFESKLGTLQDNITENAFFSTLNAVANIGAIFKEKDETEFSFIDESARGITALFNIPSLFNNIFHVRNPKVFKLSEVLVDTVKGCNIDKVSFEHFIDILIANLDKKTMREHVESILLHKGWLDDVKENTKFILLQNRTDEILENVGFSWSKLNDIGVRNMLRKSFDERISFIMKHPAFGSLSSLETEKLAFAAKEIGIDKEALLFSEGAVADKIYLIKDGLIEISKKSLFGWTGTIKIESKKGLLGIEAILDEKKYLKSAEALLGEADLYEFDTATIDNLTRENPDFARKILFAAIERINLLEKLYVSN